MKFGVANRQLQKKKHKSPQSIRQSCWPAGEITISDPRYPEVKKGYPLAPCNSHTFPSFQLQCREVLIIYPGFCWLKSVHPNVLLPISPDHRASPLSASSLWPSLVAVPLLPACHGEGATGPWMGWQLPPEPVSEGLSGYRSTWDGGLGNISCS